MIAERASNDEAAPGFRFNTVPAPRVRDLAAGAAFKLVQGEADANSGGLTALHDGRWPGSEDEPARNFFFAPGTDGGRILVDLGEPSEWDRVVSYSWHPGARGPQVYRLFAARGDEPGFAAEPKRPLDPEQAGWRLVADVDTRPAKGEPGGQYGVCVSNVVSGPCRYLLFDIRRAGARDAFGNTFYSEIDVLGRNSPEEPADTANPALEIVHTGGCEVVLDTQEAPGLTAWARTKVAPMVREWYPKLIAMLPSEGFEAPGRVSVVFDPQMRGVAATQGSRVRCSADWFEANLEGEALGAVFHELAHVAQQYRRARSLTPGATRPPGWLVEGIADYLRWYRFEPSRRGAEITAQGLPRARYDGSYRISANFLNWASESYCPDLVARLNAAIREGRYREESWREATGHSLPELGDQWRLALKHKLGIDTESAVAP